MKKNHILTAGILAIVMVLSSCEKEFKYVIVEQKDLAGKASVKFYNSIVNSSRNFVYADNIPVTGSITSFATAALFPAVSPSYFMLDAGSRTITVKDTAVVTTQIPLEIKTNLEAGKYYTMIAYDSITNPKMLALTDNIQFPTDTTSRLRFVNVIYTTTPVSNVDVFSFKRQANIFTNVSIAQATDFIPYASAFTDTLQIRATGTTTSLAQLNTLVLTQKRSYTIVFRGRYQSTSGTVSRVANLITTY
jgi:hypothetical protein